MMDEFNWTAEENRLRPEQVDRIMDELTAPQAVDLDGRTRVVAHARCPRQAAQAIAHASVGCPRMVALAAQ